MERSEIRWGTPDDAQAVCAIWRGAVAWLESIGQPLWRAEQFADDAVEAVLQSGRLVVGLSDARVVACMMVSDVDREFWPEAAAGTALYVHKLAVLRSEAGGHWSKSLLDWAAAAAKGQGVQAVRLDCAPRQRLLQLYAQHGFVRVDEDAIQIGGFLTMRLQRRVEVAMPA